MMSSAVSEIYKLLTPKLQALGFQRKGKIFLLRNDDFAFCIGVECPGNVYPVFFVIPLFIPTECPYLTYGNRLNDMSLRTRLGNVNGNPANSELEAWSVEVEEVVKREILPFVDRYAAPDTLMQFLNQEEKIRRRFLFCPPYEILRLRAYICLRQKDRENAEKLLKEYRNSILTETPFTDHVKHNRVEETLNLENLLRSPDEQIDQFLVATRSSVLKNCFKL